MNGLALIGVTLIAAGFLLVAFSALRAGGKTEGEAGGILLVGPFPIVFGSSEKTAFLAIVAGLVLLALFAFIAFLFLFKRW